MATKTDIFIEKAKLVHGDKYDYSKVKYEGSHEKVCIICPEHGEFWQTPTNHLSGKKCPKCGRVSSWDKRGRKNTEEFIKESIFIHGNKYDYSKVEYKGCKVKVCIICPEHGEFWQTPDKHLNEKSGCPFCGNKSCGEKLRLTTEEFIKKAKKVHGDKYDYSNVNYINYSTKVCIVCPIHGEFWQTPNNHLTGCGCKQCKKSIKAVKITPPKNEIFIKKAKKVHGDKYDYSKVDYKKSSEKVCIICTEHGEFWQTPNNHLKGEGCPVCAGKKINNYEIIKRFKLVHGDKYDYSKVDYKKSNEKVCIICQKHGEFWQSPNKHIQGHGCPICKESNLEKEIRLFLEKNKINNTPQKSFLWLKMKGYQRLDFYLPEYNIAIECQGKQHFYADDYYFNSPSPEDELKHTIERDISKYNNCLEHGIKIIYYVGRAMNKKDIVNSQTFEFIYKKENVFTDKHSILKWLVGHKARIVEAGHSLQLI